MSTHNIGFYEEISKIIPELSSNMHLISSSVIVSSPLNHMLWVLIKNNGCDSSVGRDVAWDASGTDIDPRVRHNLS